MDVAIRILSAVMLLLSVAALVIAVIFVRRETAISVRRDVVRVIVAFGTILIMNAVLDVETPQWAIAIAVLAGGGIGFAQGRNLAIRVDGNRTYAQRTVWGVVAWGAGTVLIQAAGVVNRAGIAQLGLAAGLFGGAVIVGLLVGRAWAISQSQSTAAPSTVILLLFALVVGSGFGEAAPESGGRDVRDVYNGAVPGLTVQIRGTGIYYGDSVRLDFTNTTGQPIRVHVPIGLKLVPGDASVQTMITAGGEVIEVPPTSGPPHSEYIKAFCGEMHDGIPPSSEVFTPGELVDARTIRTIRRIQDGGFYDYTGQEAMWHLSDNADLSNNELSRQLVAPATEIPAEDAIRLSLAGLTGSVLLLANALVNAGHSVDDVLNAWRSGRLRDLLSADTGMTTEPDDSFVYRDPLEEAKDPDRVRSILDKLPPDQSRRDAEEQLIRRLQEEEDRRALDRIRDAIGPIAPDADISNLMQGNDQVDEVLDALPDETRRRLLESLQRTLEQERLRNAVDVGINVLDRERKVEALIDARNDQNQPWRYDEMLNKLDDKTLDQAGNRIDEGGGPIPPDQSLDIDNLVDEDDLLVALRRNPTARQYLDSLPPDIRPQVEAEMVRLLEEQRRNHLLNQVRDAVGPIGPDTDLDRALRDDNVREILNRVPPSESIPIETQIRNTLEQEQLGNTVEQAHSGVNLNRVEQELRDAVRRGRPEEAARILDAASPEDAAELVKRVEVPTAAKPSSPGLPPTQKPAPSVPASRTPPAGPGAPPATPLPPPD